MYFSGKRGIALRGEDASAIARHATVEGGQLYAEDCYLAGTVEYIWNEGAAYFSRSGIKTVGRSGAA